MSLHEKIFQLRRAAGLSQEELAGKLGVSRQAVGKWENGAALPDIGNLIALSKLFSVPLTELLGLDEPAGAAADSAARDEAIAAIEQLLRRQATNSRVAQNAQSAAIGQLEERQTCARRNTLIAFGCAAALIAALAIGGARRISRLEEQLHNLSSQTFQQTNNLYWEIDDLQSTLTGLLRSQASLFTDVTCQPTGYDPQTETVAASIAAAPKTLTEGSTAEFTLTEVNTGETHTAAAALDGGTFRAELEVPSGTSELRAALVDDGVQQNETMGQYSITPIGLAVDYNIDFLPDETIGFQEQTDGSWRFTFAGTLVLESWPREWLARDVASITLTIHVNSEPAATVTLDPGDPDHWPDRWDPPYDVNPLDSSASVAMEYTAPDGGALFVQPFASEPLPCTAGDEIRVDLEVTDALGLVYRAEGLFEARCGQTGMSYLSGGGLSLDYARYE